MTTLLERAKGSALEIITDHEVPLGTTTLLLPHVPKIRRLDFQSNYFEDILWFSEVNSGPLPLLRTLWICLNWSNIPATPSLPLFNGAVNLEEFVLGLEQAKLLKHFVFPNLTTFKLLALQMDGLDASHLFDFLKGSPTLQTIEVKVAGGIMLGNIHQDMVIVLPNVETFSLFIEDNEHEVYEPAARLSCPRAKYTSLMQKKCDDAITTGLEIFPDSIPWKEITSQYASSPVEEITLEMTHIAYSLTFQTSDATVIRLGFELTDTGRGEEEEEEDFDLTWEEMHLEIFSQACKTIQAHPLLSHVKRLHIKDRTGAWGLNNLISAAKMVGDLFKSLGPLDKFTINSFDLQIFLAPFVDAPQFWRFERVFPPVKELTVSVTSLDEERRCLDAVVELAKSRHKLGIPFERVTVRAREVSADMMRRLREWVSAAECCEM